MPRGFLQKDENKRWNLYENLPKTTIQWEPTNENSRNSNSISSISSKGDLHSIQSSIAAGAKIVTIMRRLEALKTREPVPVNQVSLGQFQLWTVLIVKQ